MRKINFAVVTLTALYLFILATRLSESFFGPAEWQWHGRPPAASTYDRWWPSILLLLLYVAIAWLWLDRVKKPGRSREWLGLLLLVGLIPAIQIALKYIHTPQPITFYLNRTIGPHNGFWQVAIANDDLGHYLRTYIEQMTAYPFVHTPVHPPGNFVYIWLWRKFFIFVPRLSRPVAQAFRYYNCQDLPFVMLTNDQIAAALAQMTLPLLSGLAVIPLYFWVKRLAGERTGFRAAALFGIMPAFTLFTMRWDQFYPLFWATAFYFFQVGLDRASQRQQTGAGPSPLAPFFVSGLVVSVMSFMSFGNFTILPLIGCYALAHLAYTGRSHWRAWLTQLWPAGLIFFGGVASVWLLNQLFFGVSFWQIFQTVSNTHFFLGRTYWLWLGYNLWDLVTFIGLPVAVILLVACWQGWQMVWRQTTLGRAWLPAVAFGPALLLLDLSGVSLGEVGRMWLPWMAVGVVVAALALGQVPSTASYPLVLSLMALQTLFFTLFLRVTATGMPDYQPRSPNWNAPAISQPVNGQVGSFALLAGYELSRPEQQLELTLYWQALQRPAEPYTVFVHLVDSNGQIQAQQDAMPLQNSLPTTCWQAGEWLVDRYQLDVGNVPAGVYTLEMGLYYLPTLNRLPIAGPTTPPYDRIILQQLTIDE